MSNYSLVQPTGLSANITAKPLTVSGTTVADKVYDGNNVAALSGASLVGLVTGDAVTLRAAGQFTDKNVGVGKLVTAGNTIEGQDLSNYSLVQPTGLSANISRLKSVNWVGGASGNWFDPKNWQGGVVPDRDNVANVSIPSDSLVFFDTSAVVLPADATQPVKLDSLGATGKLNQSSGTLNIGQGGMTLDGFAQSGGSLTVAGALTVNGPFTQGATGSVLVQGNSLISSGSAAVQLGNFNNSGDLYISSGSAISQAAGTTIVVSGKTTLQAPGQAITLDGADNDFVGPVSVSGGGTRLRDKNALTVALNTTGTTSLEAGEVLTISGDLQGSNSDLALVARQVAFGNTNVGGRLNSTTWGADALGGVLQTGSIQVDGKAEFFADRGAAQDAILTDTKNNFKAGTNFNGSNGGSWGTTRVGGDAMLTGGDPGSKISAGLESNTLPGTGSGNTSPGTGSGNTSMPRPLVLPSLPASSDASSGTSANAESFRANSTGVTVDRQSTNQQDNLMVAVSLPKGASTVGTGFRFNMPESVKDMVSAEAEIRITQTDGSPPPSWLKFDRQELRFDASAVPDNGLPMQLVVTLAGQRVMVVISERTE